MRVTKITTYVARVPLGEKRFYSSQTLIPERTSLLVKIETDDGLVGWGEGGQYGPAQPVAACIDHVLASRVIGQDPRARGKIWNKLYAMSRDFGQKGAYVEAISAIDIALWDITGKATGEPVCRLLGGPVRETVAAYATGCYYQERTYLDRLEALPQLQEEAKSYKAAGFGILKTKIGLLEVGKDLERMAAIREAVGPKIVLLADANHAYNPAVAIQMGRGLEELDVRWYEEPVPPEDLDGYRRVRQALSMAITGGECEFTRFGFRELIAGGCVDVAQPDICASGGLSEWQKIVALGEAFGVRVVPHVWGSGVALATALHAVAALPPAPHTANPVPLQNEPVVEYDRTPNPLRDDLLAEKFELKNGRLTVPQGPGLGITVQEDVLAEYV